MEDDGSRSDYFHLVYEKEQVPEIIKEQPEYWYRAGFDAKPFQILLSRLARREIYDANYRQWHWRVAGEQLIYSHADHTKHGDTTKPRWYELNTVRTLLIAGQDDNYPYVGIYDGTKTLGYSMTKTEGRLLLIKDAGHSIHFEHPRFLAYEIVKFLNARSMQITRVTREKRDDDDEKGPIERVGGRNCTDESSFDMSQEEVFSAIERGDEFYVTDSRGQEVIVRVIQGLHSGEYLRSVADDGLPQLELLPDC